MTRCSVAGGTLAQWASAGGETMIVSATRGEVGQIHDVRASTRSTLGAVRERELRSACADSVSTTSNAWIIETGPLPMSDWRRLRPGWRDDIRRLPFRRLGDVWTGWRLWASRPHRHRRRHHGGVPAGRARGWLVTDALAQRVPASPRIAVSRARPMADDDTAPFHGSPDFGGRSPCSPTSSARWALPMTP